MKHTFATSGLGAAILFAGLSAAQTPGKVDFRRDIQPLFQEKCIGCHGRSQQSAGMRLDQRSSAMAVRGSTMIGPGNAVGSVLYLKVSGTRFGQRMPPAGPLDPAQIEAIKNWIDQGAEWPDDLSGDTASLKRLIDLGADPNVANDAGATALMWAIDDEQKTRHKGPRT